MVTAKDVINSIKPKKISKVYKTPLGEIGYDNVRDDLEKVKKLREGSVEKVPVNNNDIVNKLALDTAIAAVDHTAIANIGTNTHAQIDAHLTDSSDPHGSVLTQTTIDVTPSYTAGYMSNSVAGGIYVPRYSIALDKADFTTNGNWNNWDVSAIVPAGAKAVVIRIVMVDNAVGSYLHFRREGSSDSTGLANVRTQVANVVTDGDLIVGCDSSRVVEYRGSNLAFTILWGSIVGWFI